MHDERWREALVTLHIGRSFPGDLAVSILDAARAAGITLEYSSRIGRCRIYKVPVVLGATTVLRDEAGRI